MCSNCGSPTPPHPKHRVKLPLVAWSKTTKKSHFGEGKFNVCPPSPSAVSIGCRTLGAKLIKNSLANAEPVLVIRVIGRHLTSYRGSLGFVRGKILAPGLSVTLSTSRTRAKIFPPNQNLLFFPLSTGVQNILHLPELIGIFFFFLCFVVSEKSSTKSPCIALPMINWLRDVTWRNRALLHH